MAARTRDQHFANDGQPKRILSLDGGGVRGMLSIGILKKIEDELRERHPHIQPFRLCHYFDLIAGTSTGAIIAAALAKGATVDELRDKYLQLGTTVFSRGCLPRWGFFRPRYDEAALVAELKREFGDVTLGSSQLQTGLLIVTKRLDTKSVWPLSNNPSGKFYDKSPHSRDVANKDYPLWQVIRASTAAPYYFRPEFMTIGDVGGTFVDGAVSPHKDPSLQAFMFATLAGYKVSWPTGEDELLLVSVGTGSGHADATMRRSWMSAAHAVASLRTLINDGAEFSKRILQWISDSPTAMQMDGEVGDLQNDCLAGSPLLTYLRYDVNDLGKELFPMDNARNMPKLYDLGIAAGARDVNSDHFKLVFDLPAKPAADVAGRHRYRRRPHRPVVAVRMDLELVGREFRFVKWGGEQRCKQNDWVVNNNGDCYIVDADVFAATYQLARPGQPGLYVKKTPVWAERAAAGGSVPTHEGVTAYTKGDYVVSNRQDGSDSYAMSASQFEELYELDE